MVDQAYFQEIKQYQKQLDDQLQQQDSWLTLAGLYWLKEGKNTVGANPEMDVALPAGAAPAKVGVIELTDKKVTFAPAPESGVMSGGVPVTGKIELESDLNRNQTILEIGKVSFYLIIRGSRYGIRVKHEDNPTRLKFEGRIWWPVDDNRRVTAKIHWYEPQKMVDIPDVLGDVTKTAMDCALEFTIDGRPYKLDAYGLPSGQFYILFHDLSCHNGSYPAGRFLVTEYPDEDTVVLDFNKAHNPPCAFTPYATCPLPPEQNYMSVAIQAGERYKPLDGAEH